MKEFDVLSWELVFVTGVLVAQWMLLLWLTITYVHNQLAKICICGISLILTLSAGFIAMIIPQHYLF